MRKYLSIALLLFLSACGGTSYQAVDKNTASSMFSAIDQKMLVETLASKLVNDQSFKAELGGDKPTLLIDTIKNKTSEHIDTESMTDTLKVSIVKSRLFSIINREKMDILAKENAIAQSGLADSQRATELGRLWGAKYVMYGNFSSIVNFVGSQKQTYYKFTLIVQNIETGEEVWIDEAEINKVSKKGMF